MFVPFLENIGGVVTMNTTLNEQKELERKENFYYYKKQKNIIYNKNNYHYNILIEWIKFVEENNDSQLNVYQEKRQIIYFLNFLENNQIYNLKLINKEVIIKYINSYPYYFRKVTIKNYNKHLRKILRFLFQKNYINKDLSVYVPFVKVSRNCDVPSVWSEEELIQIFSQIDMNTPIGKRLYLVLLLSLRYGLRSVDIRNLKFENIDWNNKNITIIQSKTKKEVSFKLLDDVSSALIDYIKNARPKSNQPYIIVTVNGDYIDHYNFYKELKELLQKTNINCKGKKIGIHSMRHTLASLLLKENIPLNIISTILGHNNFSSSTIYTKIDQLQLRKCCLSLKEVIIDE